MEVKQILQEKTYYTIKRGDTLWRISRRYGVSVQNIVSWNNIQNPKFNISRTKIDIVWKLH